MTHKIELPERPKLRNYFERDSVFESESKQPLFAIMNAYDEASAIADRHARLAIQFPTDANMMKARIAEAVVQTFERVLESFPYESGAWDSEGSDTIKLPVIIDEE